MFPSNNRISFGRRLTAIALATTMAGCSLNPFADNDPAAPVASASTTAESAPAGGDRGASSSRSQTAYATPTAQLVTAAVPLASGHPDDYTVREGDTLWDIAATFLKDPWYWPEVWYVNPQVENPHLIYPGDVLALITIDGRPRITNMRGSSYRLSPQARISPINESITSIPYEAISAFLAKGLILEKSEIKELPYILAIRGDHMIGAAGNDIYVRGGTAAPTGTRYSVVHVGEELVDPDDGKAIGYLGTYVGGGALTRGGDPATISLTDTGREAIAGDRLVPEPTDIPLNFFPKAPDSDIDGSILSVVDGVELIGQFQVVVLNRGTRDGMDPGDVLTVFQTGEVISDRFAAGSLVSRASMSRGPKVKLPDEEAGTVMVFKVYDRISYALVVEAYSDIHVLDAVRSPN